MSLVQEETEVHFVLAFTRWGDKNKEQAAEREMGTQEGKEGKRRSQLQQAAP